MLALGAVCALTAMALGAQAEHAQPPEEGGGQALHFDHKAGNEWWVEVVLGGFFANDIDRVAARDDGGPWVQLTLRDWGAWAGSFRIEPGHRVQFRAVWLQPDGVSENMAWTSCWFTHPAGVEQCTPQTLPPEMSASTYVGLNTGAPIERVYDVATDSAGNAYVVGERQTVYGDFWTADAFVRKVNAGGSLGWTRILGGSHADDATGVAVDSAGNVYVGGTTWSGDFPANGWRTGKSQFSDGFLAKLDPNGNVVYSTFLGGSDGDSVTDVGVTSDGLAYAVGITWSCDYPTYGQAFQASIPGCTEETFQIHGFVTKLTANGMSAVYSTYLAGSGTDRIKGAAVSPASGSIWVTGETDSTDFPVTTGALQPTKRGGVDAFVTKFSPIGALEASTYFGGTGDDKANAIARDNNGNPYIAGETMSTDVPTTAGAPDRTYATGLKCSGWSGGPNPYWVEEECPDAFVAKLSADAKALTYGTYLGQEFVDYAEGIAVDASGRAYVTGRTNSTNWPLVGGRAGPGGGYFDSFAHVLSADGTTILHSTPLGGTDGDFGESVAVDANGNAWYAGWTWSLDFPVTPGAGQSQREGGEDGFATRFKAPGSGGHADPVITFDHRGGNEWWVEVSTGGLGAKPTQVQAMDNNSPWTTLTLRDWGNWAGSFRIEPGNTVKFRGMVGGAWYESCAFTHPGGLTPTGGQSCPGTTTNQPTTFDASFTGAKGNDWWVEVYVSANQPLGGVDARVNCSGDWKPLTLRSWGAWAASFNVPAGSKVDFRARNTSGASDLSGGYVWPQGTPTTAC